MILKPGKSYKTVAGDRVKVNHIRGNYCYAYCRAVCTIYYEDLGTFEELTYRPDGKFEPEESNMDIIGLWEEEV